MMTYIDGFMTTEWKSTEENTPSALDAPDLQGPWRLTADLYV